MLESIFIVSVMPESWYPTLAARTKTRQGKGTQASSRGVELHESSGDVAA
jgi:hypothetical protein